MGDSRVVCKHSDTASLEESIVSKNRIAATFAMVTALLVGIGIAAPPANAATSVSKFTAQVARAADKRLNDGYRFTKAQQYGAIVSIPGVKRGYAGVKAVGYYSSAESTYDSSTSDLRRIHTAVRKELVRKGLKVRLSIKGDNPVTLLTNGHYACSISRASFGCTTAKKAKAGAKRMKPIAQAYLTKYPSKYRMSFWGLESAKSPVKGYRKATAAIDGLPSFSGAGGLFYKAPGKKWRLARVGQDVALCKELEKTRDMRRAFVGETCYRGAGYTESKVRL